MTTKALEIPYTYAAKVERVVDGDTAVLLIDVGFDLMIRQHVRFYGVNAPEHGTPDGDAAKAWTTAKLPPGASVVIQTIKDKTEKYGRLLGKLYLADPKGAYDPANSVNDQLVAAKMAKPYFGGART